MYGFPRPQILLFHLKKFYEIYLPEKSLSISQNRFLRINLPCPKASFFIFFDLIFLVPVDLERKKKKKKKFTNLQLKMTIFYFIILTEASRFRTTFNRHL